MVAFLLMQTCIGGMILRLRRRFSWVRLLIYVLGSVLGSFAGMFLIGMMAVANPITTDPGSEAIQRMRLVFLAMAMTSGVLGGLLTVGLSLRLTRAPEWDDAPGLNPDR